MKLENGAGWTSWDETRDRAGSAENETWGIELEDKAIREKPTDGAGETEVL